MINACALLKQLDRDVKSGKLLPAAELVGFFQSARPLDGEALAVLAECLKECSEQIYEHYRPLIDMFREDILSAVPDEQTVRTGIALGILDDEEWQMTGGKNEWN